MKANEAHDIQEKAARSSQLIEDVKRGLKKAINKETLSLEESMASTNYNDVYYDGWSAGEKSLAGELMEILK